MGFKYLFPTLSFKNCHPLDAGMSKISLSRLSEVLSYSGYFSKLQNTETGPEINLETGPEINKKHFARTGNTPEVEMIINSFL